MYTSQFLPLLQHRIRVGTMLKCIPFVFDQTLGRFVQNRSPWQLRIFKVQCVLSVLYAGGMLANLCFGPLTTTGRMQGVGFFIVYFAATLMQWNYCVDIGPIQLINSVLDFERGRMSTTKPVRLSLGAKAMKIFIQIVEVSILLYPVLQFFLLRFLPCTPPFILSMFPGCLKGNDETLTEYILKVVVQIFESCLTLTAVISGTTWMFYVLFAGIVFILNYFRILK
ncbi:hypothetical protein Fcan01_24307, partial [Folsomia candida]